MRSSVSILLLLAACTGAPDFAGGATRPAIASARPGAAVTLGAAGAGTYEAVGYASWYGEELRGNRTASGERFDPAGITAAHRTLPLGSFAEVTALDSGRTVTVRINDRGPHRRDREIDLSRGAAELLAAGRSVFSVRVRAVRPTRAARKTGVTTSPALAIATPARPAAH